MADRRIYSCLAGITALVFTGWLLAQGPSEADLAGEEIAYATHSGRIVRPQNDLPSDSGDLPGNRRLPADDSGTAVEFSPYLNWLSDEAQEESLPGYALAIVSSDGIVDLRTTGVRHVERQAPVTPDTVFRIASVSKTFAGTVASQLVARDIHSWDEPLTRILPQYSIGTAPVSSGITLKHIMSHSTGLMPHAYSNMLDAGVGYREIQEKFDEIPTVCEPGECYGYQNVVFSLIADVVRESVDSGYDDYVRSRLFEPLGMSSASLGFDAYRRNGNASAPHRHGRDEWQVSSINPAYFTVGPASGVNASIRDMSQWARANLGAFPDVLPRPVLDMQHSPIVETTHGGYYNRWSALDKAWYGIGWRVFDYAGTRVVHHGGGVRGFRSEMVLIPERDLAMVVLFNAQTSLANDVVPQFLDTVLAQAH